MKLWMVLMQISIFAYADSLNVLLLMNVMWLWPIYLMQPKFVFQMWGKKFKTIPPPPRSQPLQHPGMPRLTSPAHIRALLGPVWFVRNEARNYSSLSILYKFIPITEWALKLHIPDPSHRRCRSGPDMALGGHRCTSDKRSPIATTIKTILIGKCIVLVTWSPGGQSENWSMWPKLGRRGLSLEQELYSSLKLQIAKIPKIP